MKFAKELEQDLVPEWRAKYLDYKVGKKRVKAVARASNRLTATPKTPAVPPRKPSKYGSISPFKYKPSPFGPKQQASSLRPVGDQNDGPTDPLRDSPAAPGTNSRPDSYNSVADPLSASALSKTPPMTITRKAQTEEDDGMYGSFVATPPVRRRVGTFELPEPAVQPGTSIGEPEETIMSGGIHDGNSDARPQTRRHLSDNAQMNAYEVGITQPPPHKTAFASLRNRIAHTNERPFARRIFSVGTPLAKVQSRKLDMDLVVVDQVRMRQQEFFAWMDRELEKVESFYKMKEDESGARLEVLREQLHEMRNRRIEEVAEQQRVKHPETSYFDFAQPPNGQKQDENERPNSRDRLTTWFDPLERMIGDAKAKAMAKTVRPGPNSKGFQNMVTTPALGSQNQADRKDFVRRPVRSDGVPYRTAKRKLKVALKEFYRSMELLKSYALLNRTAFRKINKKYDKAINAHPPLRYMSEKVNKAWFVKSDVLDGHLHVVEDLYARYFERGNHKVAVGKLRSAHSKHRDVSGSAFRNGMLIGIGAVFSIQGVIYGAELLNDDDPLIVTETSYLLQIYGGYFLGLYLFSWFCLDCAIWTKHKINYQFVFEFDPRHTLDWRQLSEFPSFLIFLLGLFVWCTFTRYGAPEMYIYFPVILMGVTVLLVFLPAPILFHRSRRWFAYSLWRLFWAGIYPVEFRDFFMGDMFCSLTYLMSNIELFFCLYANYWTNPTQCNSSHSRLLGFLSALPGVWRALQCLRRYSDTRNIFPHLVNFGKYIMSCMYLATLSIYRIQPSNHHLAAFVTLATINAIYSSIWDLLMDWSLLQPQANKRFLRDVRAYKNPLYYYIVMILDPILRFNWIFYAVYTHDLQHNTIVAFLVAFSEVTRRGLWVIFRVENEHCSNVARFKASRDVPLPYEICSDWNDEPVDSAIAAEGENNEHQVAAATSTAQTSPALRRHRTDTVVTAGTIGTALESQHTNSSSSTLRRRMGPIRALTRIVANAHTQDFEKKRKPGQRRASLVSLKLRKEGEECEEDAAGSSDDEEDDEEQNAEDVADAQALLRERGQGGGSEGAV